MFYNFDNIFWCLLLYVVVAPLVTLTLGIIAFRRSTHIRRELSILENRLRVFERESSHSASPRSILEPDRAPAQQAPREQTPAPAEVFLSKTPEPTPEPPPAPTEIPASAPAQPTAPKAAPKTEGWEQRFATKWMLWLGGLALALGAAFLVKVTIDAGLLTPGLRCTLGALLGLGLAVGGEAIRRRPLQIAIAESYGNHLPTALSAAGIAALFASIYAAHGLYDLLPAGLAFPLFGLTALAALGLGLLQGPFLAGLGLLGGFVTPLLVQSSHPEAWPLFTLLSVLALTALALARYRDWTWLAASALSGALAWALLWAGCLWQSGDGTVFGLYLLTLAAAAVGFRYGLLTPLSQQDLAALPWAERQSKGGGLAELQSRIVQFDLLVSLAALGLSINAFCLLRLDHYSLWSLSVMALLAGFFCLSGRRVAALAALPWLAATTVLLGLALWHLPQIVEGTAPLLSFDGHEAATPRQPIVPPALMPFTLASGFYAVLFAALGYLLSWGAKRPGVWASLATAMPLAILILAYGRIAHFQVSLSWAGLSLLIGGLALWAASKYRRAGPEMTGALGASAVAVVAAVALAATMELREAWLTVALSLMLPAMAWIDEKLRLDALRKTAFAIAAVIIFRLVVNQSLLSGHLLAHPLFNWLLYGYGLPCLAFGIASIVFRRHKDDALVALLESGAILFLTLLVTFETRSLFNNGDLTASSHALVEQATLILAWIGLAIGLLAINGRHRRPVLSYAWKLLASWGLLYLTLGPMIMSNPLFTGAEVGNLPLLNLLSLTYLAPALLLGLLAWQARRQGETLAAHLGSIAALVLLFVDLSLEVRHGFHGSRLDLGVTTTAEWYAYSLAWLIFASSLLGLGLRFARTALRHAGLALLALVVVKVFLFDMAALTGLYRAISFLGLGAGLVMIGYLYQHLILPTGAAAQVEQN